VARWLEAATKTLAALKAEGKLAIVVGGTGLYFAALERGLSPIPEIDAEIRAAARQRHAEMGSEAFYEELRARDPLTAAQLNPQDAQRVIRAWEVLEATGQPLAEWQSIKGTPAIDVTRTGRFVLMPERETLYGRADKRFDVMMAAGALDEARAFAALEPDPAWPASRALGLRQLSAHLAGETSLEAAIEDGKRETRRYAKRQMTWFRNQMADWQVLAAADISAAALKILAAVRQGP
jgi:tRNA dimethylallyltransferase